MIFLIYDYIAYFLKLRIVRTRENFRESMFPLILSFTLALRITRASRSPNQARKQNILTAKGVRVHFVCHVTRDDSRLRVYSLYLSLRLEML